jgi:hypothetical protein
MTKDELELRRARMAWSTRVLGGHCAFANFVLDLMKVSGLSYEASETELISWLEKGIPFEETVEAYTYGGPPEILSDEISLSA